MFHVYVIVSAEGYRYVGSTSNLQKRLSQHNRGISRWTRRGNGWTIVYTEVFPTRVEATKRERWLKSGVGRDYLKTIVPHT